MAKELVIKPVQEVTERTQGSMETIKSNERAEKMKAAIIIAKKFPRDEIQAEQRIKEACSRAAFATAKDTIYAYPRGGETVRGPGVRMAEMMARYWGNIHFGFDILEQKTNESIVEAYCWDLETNVQEARTFVVSHSMKANNSIKNLTDPRDVYEHVANMAKRRQRSCILHLIPSYVVDLAVSTIGETKKKLQSNQKTEPLIDRIKKVVTAFADLGVSKEMLEKRLGHNMDLTVEDEMDDLADIYRSIKDGETQRTDWFKFSGPNAEGGGAGKLNEKFAQKAPAPGEEK